METAVMNTTEIWNAFSKELKRFIMKRVKDTDATNDLMQDIFIKIHLNSHSLKEVNKLTSWVYSITRNSLNDYFNKLNSTEPLNAQLTELPTETTLNSEFAHCMKPLIEALPAAYRTAIEQTELEGVPQNLFAENCGLSYSGAKSRVQRGRLLLKQMMTDCCKIHFDKYGNIYDFNRNPDCKLC